MSRGFQAHFLEETEFEAWDEFVRRAVGGSIYHTCSYLEALCRAAGGSYRVLAVRKGEEMVGGVPLFERERGGERYVAPRLLLYYNGPIFLDTETRYPSKRTSLELGVISSLLDELESVAYGRVTLRGGGELSDVRGFLVRGWRAIPKYTYVVPLLDLEEVRGRVEQNLRRLVGRAEKKGYRTDREDDFESFYELHRSTLSRHGQAPYLAMDAFRIFFNTLKDEGCASLLNVRTSEGRVVASALFLLGEFDVAHTVCAGGSEDHLSDGVNPFLRWKSFEWLMDEGYAGNDLTDATLNAVTRFKSQLGGDLVPSYELDAPRSRGYRWSTAVARARTRVRGAFGGVVRKAMGR